MNCLYLSAYLKSTLVLNSFIQSQQYMARWMLTIFVTCIAVIVIGGWIEKMMQKTWARNSGETVVVNSVRYKIRSWPAIHGKYIFMIILSLYCWLDKNNRKLYKDEVENWEIQIMLLKRTKNYHSYPILDNGISSFYHLYDDSSNVHHDQHFLSKSSPSFTDSNYLQNHRSHLVFQ
jgi:hypothetical protein